MSQSLVEITPQTEAALQALAQQLGEPMPSILEKAVEAYRTQKLLEATNEAYAALRADPEAWAEELAERQLWE